MSEPLDKEAENGTGRRDTVGPASSCAQPSKGNDQSGPSSVQSHEPTMA